MFNPRYTLSNRVLNEIASIERLTAQLDNIVIPKEVYSHINQQCLVALTHFSTQIEGNKLSMEQVSGVVEQRKTYGLLRDEKEVKNYFSLLEKIPALIEKHNGKINLKLLLSCHAQIQDGIIDKPLQGKFRDVQNAIYEAGSNKLVYLPPEPSDVPVLIEDLCNWLEGAQVHPIIVAAIFHNQLVTIHPFIDGNGRSARFLSLYLLYSRGYEWHRIVPVDRYYADNRDLYYATLQGSYSHNYYEGRADTDFTEWLEYYVVGLKEILAGTINLVELYRAENILMNNRQVKILKFLRENKSITTQQYAARFQISTRMASRDLTQLLEWRKIGSIGKARATRYFLK